MSTALKPDADLEIAPIAGYLGAEVAGVSLAETISDAVADRLRTALYEHKVLFLRDQQIDHGAGPPDRRARPRRRPCPSSPSTRWCASIR